MSEERKALKSAKVYTAVDLEAAQFFDVASGQVSLFTRRSPDKKTTEDVNDDGVAVFPRNNKSVVLAVADGVGGQPIGHKAAEVALDALNSSLKKGLKNSDDPRYSILNGIEKANKAVLELGVGAATTLAVVLVEEKRMRPFHVGDSLILTVGQKGKIKGQNVAHSPVGYAVEAGLLDEDAAMHHEERHLVSNLVGSPEMRIEIGSVSELSQNDTIVVASDGLSDNLTTDEITERVRKGSLKTVSEVLINDATERMHGEISDNPSKKDDMTFIAFRLS